MRMPDGRVFEVKKKFSILGVTVDARGNPDVAREGRGVEGLKTWWGHRQILTAFSLPVNMRIARFAATVGASLLHGCGAWLPSKTTCTWFLQRELHHLREVVGCKRREGESWGLWLQRSAKQCHAARSAAGVPSLCHTHILRHQAWMGHTSRSWSCGCWSPAQLALELRPLPWWREVQITAPRAEDRLAGQGRHEGRKTWQDNIELRLEEFYGSEWRLEAADRVSWARSSKSFLAHLVSRWSLPKAVANAAPCAAAA